jgi:hypothetical protein
VSAVLRSVRVKPPQEQCHISPKLTTICVGHNPQNAIAISIRIKKYLLDKKNGRLAHYLAISS